MPVFRDMDFSAKNPEESEGTWKLLSQSKYPGSCIECGAWIEEGDPVWWKRGEGVRHPSCQPAPEPKRGMCKSCWQSVPEHQMIGDLCTGCV